jgi:hypothetical protein
LLPLANAIRGQQGVPLDRSVGRFCASGVHRTKLGLVMKPSVVP